MRLLQFNIVLRVLLNSVNIRILNAYARARRVRHVHIHDDATMIQKLMNERGIFYERQIKRNLYITLFCLFYI